MNRPMLVIFTAILSGALLSGCAANRQKYSWSGYDQALYDYYKHPGDTADYMKALRTAIDDAGRINKPVAPGIFAEYGYLLMQQKQYEKAAYFFGREKATWPESARFMDGMIKTARANGTPSEGKSS